MSLIKIDLEGLLGNRDSLQKQIDELQSLNSKLEALIDRIGDSWDGAASDAYVAKLRTYYKQAVTMITVLKTFKTYAEKAAKEFESSDKSAASQIRNSF